MGMDMGLLDDAYAEASLNLKKARGILSDPIGSLKSQWDQGAPYRGALSGLLRGDMDAAAKSLDDPRVRETFSPTNIALAFAPMGIGMTKPVGMKALSVDVIDDTTKVHNFPNGAFVREQIVPSGKTFFYPGDSKAGIDWDRKALSLDDAISSISGMRISNALKERNSSLYGAIPKTWDAESRRVAKQLIDAGYSVDNFANSTQSKSKYLTLSDGTKIRMSNHDLPMQYDRPDFDFRFGNDPSLILNYLASKK